MNLSLIAASIAPRTLVKAALLSGVLVTFPPGVVLGQQMEKKGTTPYVTHFIFRPLMSIDIPGLGTATNLEAVGTTQNMKGEKMLDKMSAHCAALSVASGDKKYIDGACVLADSDGDKIFSTFDTRDLDKSQPKMDCGTHIITGGTGKYKGITGSEPFACIAINRRDLRGIGAASVLPPIGASFGSYYLISESQMKKMLSSDCAGPASGVASREGQKALIFQ
jgi:hypothetical protein